MKLSEGLVVNQLLREDPRRAIDPATVAMVVKVVVELVKMYKQCKLSTKEAHFVSKTRKGKGMSYLKRAVRRKLGWWKNILHGKKTVERMLSIGDNSTHSDLVKLYDEID